MIETDVPGSGEAGWPTGFVRVETTGRSIVVFESSVTDPAAVLASAAGLGNVANSRDFQDQAVDVDGTDAGGAIYFAELGVAVVSADEDQVHLLRTASSARGAVISVSPELVYHVLDADPDYVQGYRDGVTDLSGRLGATEAGARAAASAAAAPPFADTAQSPGACRPPVSRRVRTPARASGSPSWTPGSTPAIPTSPAATVTRAVLRRRAAAAGRPRPRHPLHRHVVRAAGPVDRSAVRHRLRGGHLRRQSAQQRRAAARTRGILAGINWAVPTSAP